MHPKRKSELLLTAPTSQPWTLALNSTTSSPYLQTYDTLKDLHVSRQALCRNHATSFSVGPEATTLTEPNVTHMKISRDGSWLATTEEWMQPVEDFEFQADGGLAVLAARKLRREVYLKFWLWRDDKKLWTLETRVNKPHRSSEKHVRSRVYDLVADPARSCFATIGEDRLVKLWKSTARIRDGIVVRGSKGEEMVTWSCQHAVELHKCLASLDADDDDMDTGLDEGLAAASPFVTSHPANALLAYADDGSILAACQEFEPNIGPGKVYLINPQSGQLLMVLPDLYSKNLVGLACIDRYLVTVSDELFVWDLVNGTLVYGFSLSQSDLSHDNPSSGMTGLCFAAEDLDVTPTEAEMSCHRSRTFAIVRPTVKRKSSSRTGGSQRDQSKKLSSSLMIFDPQKPNPIYSEELPYVVTALAPIPADGGYVAVDAEAGVRTIRFRRNLPAITSEEKIIASLPQDLPVQSMLVPYRSAIPRGPTDAIRMQADDSLPEDLLSVGPDVDLPVIRPEHLGRLFDSDTAHSHPRVDELYDSVLKLFTAGPETVK